MRAEIDMAKTTSPQDRARAGPPPDANPIPGQPALEIVVRDLAVDADIGIHAHEIGQPQPLHVTVRLSVDPPSSDSIKAAVDYRAIEEIVIGIAARHTNLIETFAADVGRGCLAMPLVRTADVTVSKPRALNRGLAQARIRLMRTNAP